LRTDAAICCKQTSNNRTRFWEETFLSLTILDPNAALIVVDLQKGIVGSSFVHPIAGVIARTRALIDAFRAQELPVVLVNVAGRAPGRTEQPPRLHRLSEGWADLIPELDPQPGDIIVTKRTWGAFAGTDLDARLKAKGVTLVVIRG
jgi:nicotinamidase-related amidase